MKITFVPAAASAPAAPQPASPHAAAASTPLPIATLATPTSLTAFAASVRASRVMVNDQPTTLEGPLKAVVILLAAVWKLGVPTLFALGLAALLGWLAWQGSMMTVWIGTFVVLAALLALVLRLDRMQAARIALGGAIVFLAPVPLVLGVYWHTATPTTFSWLLTLIGGLASLVLPVVLASLPGLTQWILRRLGVEPVVGAPWSLTLPGVARLSAPPPFPPALAKGAVRLTREDDVRLPLPVVFGWIGAVTGPLALAWLFATLLHGAIEIVPSWASGLYVSARHRGAHDAFAAERARRQALAARVGKTVAVTLSGGGYRAAVTHAGLLSMLDAAGIPVSVLSTVSGGSIVGAAYAQGWAPACFAAELRDRKPGLPDDLLGMTAVLGGLVRRDWGSGDVYVTHFGRRYFHDHTLEQTGPPDLVVNLTAYETGERVAVIRGRDVAGTGKPADALPLRTIVAASGAFPVAFEPVSIYGARYVDGGVLENLGVTGLAQYVAATGRVPDALIVSDLSAEPQPPRPSYKPSLFQMAVQAPDLTSRALHQIFYRTYSGGSYDRTAPTPPSQPFAVERALLWPGTSAGTVAVFVLAPTSPAERARFVSAEQARLARVARINTLQELDADDVDAAFWAGAALGRAYVGDIWRALGTPSPPPAPAAPTTPRCPR